LERQEDYFTPPFGVRGKFWSCADIANYQTIPKDIWKLNGEKEERCE
jgi:hypothetical protein